MTEPKVLADALVEDGILTKGGHITYYFPDGEMAGRGAEHTINDWRVAGACLRAWPTTINTENLDMTLDAMLRDPAAICEAFVQALANKQETAVDQDEEIERLTNRLAGDTADHILAIYLEHSWPTRRRQSVDLSVCPECGGPADNGHDRAYPPSPYLCTKCTQETEL